MPASAKSNIRPILVIGFVTIVAFLLVRVSQKNAGGKGTEKVTASTASSPTQAETTTDASAPPTPPTTAEPTDPLPTDAPTEAPPPEDDGPCAPIFPLFSTFAGHYEKYMFPRACGFTACGLTAVDALHRIYTPLFVQHITSQPISKTTTLNHLKLHHALFAKATVGDVVLIGQESDGVSFFLRHLLATQKGGWAKRHFHSITSDSSDLDGYFKTACFHQQPLRQYTHLTEGCKESCGKHITQLASSYASSANSSSNKIALLHIFVGDANPAAVLEALTNIFPHVAIGGVVVVRNLKQYPVSQTLDALLDFRETNGIFDDLYGVEGSVYFTKSQEVSGPVPPPFKTHTSPLNARSFVAPELALQFEVQVSTDDAPCAPVFPSFQTYRQHTRVALHDTKKTDEDISAEYLARLITKIKGYSLTTCGMNCGGQGLGLEKLGETMTRFLNLQAMGLLIELAAKKGLTGDVVETGVWRGGSSLFMRLVMNKVGWQDRRSYLCDSFQGLPKVRTQMSRGEDLYETLTSVLGISLDEVQENFRAHCLYPNKENNTHFVKGYFVNSMPGLRAELLRTGQKISVLRLDGDMYDSTLDVLYYLYDLVEVGGYVIIDDFGWVKDLWKAKDAIMDFRRHYGIEDDVQRR